MNPNRVTAPKAHERVLMPDAELTFFESIAIPLARDRGWKVAPCYPRRKEVHGELVPRPLKMQSRNLSQIHAWAQREPNANVCVYAQQIEGSLCFLDRDGERDIREAYRSATGKDFQTLFVRSSVKNGVERGHFYFQQTPKTRKAKNVTEESTDGWFSFRVNNFYVCSIGSIHPDTGEPYTVTDDSPIAPMPDELLEWLQAQAAPKPKTRGEAKGRGKFTEGTRYSALISEVGRLWQRGYGRELTIKTGIEWARENFDLAGEEFDEQKVRREIEHLIDSYPQGNPAPDESLARIARVEQAIAALEIDKKSDPLPAIAGVAAVEDAARRVLLVGKLAALRIPGTTKKFIEERMHNYRAEAEAGRRKATEAATLERIMAMNVEGAELLDEICTFIRRFVFLSEFQVRVAALWTMHTHAFNTAECTPYLAVTSPEKRSGKSRLLEVLNTLVANPWYTGRVTAAVLYRKIDAESPTLLLDESDAAFKSGEEYGEALRGILNTGHRRGGKATCCVGKGAEMTYQDFSTFSPKAIAGIGKLPDTVADRAIPFCLQRKMRSDKVERFRLRNVKAEAERLRECLEAWGCQNIEKLRDARPVLPEKLSDRQQDGVEPLLAIADLAGGEWPEAARRALVSLCCGTQAAEDSIGAILLSDIRQLFETQDTDRLSSAQLVMQLAEIETSPWGEWKNGKPITPIGVAHLLKPFGINPHNIRGSTAVFKGYETNDFEDSWARYLAPEGSAPDTSHAPSPSSSNATPLQGNTGAGSSDLRAATASEGVAARKVEKPNKDAACSGVAASETHAGARVCGPEEEL